MSDVNINILLTLAAVFLGFGINLFPLSKTVRRIFFGIGVALIVLLWGFPHINKSEKKDALPLTHQQETIKRAAVANGEIEDTDSHGIDARGMDELNITNTRINRSGGDGIHLEGNKKVRVIGVHIANSKGSGISISGTPKPEKPSEDSNN